MAEVHVVPDGDETQPIAAPVDSPLAALRQRIQQARQQRVLDLPVPGLERVVVRYGEVPAPELARIYRKRKKDTWEEQSLLAACDVLAVACMGIYERADDGELVADGDLLASQPDGSPVTFATLRLAETGRAVDEVRALYVTDGDVLTAADRVTEFSGYTNPNDQKALLGE